MVKIFIGNLSQDTTAEDLRSLFSQYGNISECDVLKRYGFVHMDSKTDAEAAIRDLHQRDLNGMAMNVELSRGKSKASTKVHVSNLNSDCTNQELRSKFEEYGPVVECDIVKDYAFVHLERVEDAMEAISGLDNTAFQGKLMSVQLSTSRLRTTPGMGDQTGCYVCGKQGHWSKDCHLSQNGGYDVGPRGSGGGGYGFRGGRGFPRGAPGFARGGPGFPGGPVIPRGPWSPALTPHGTEAPSGESHSQETLMSVCICPQCPLSPGVPCIMCRGRGTRIPTRRAMLTNRPRQVCVFFRSCLWDHSSDLVWHVMKENLGVQLPTAV
ncbi:hypothetical protein AAFF_G00318900 [Aldrovandia affinis]|uniref:RNA-binding protein 14 n=1 Tax=Aldrovandia affinis TaxID=143900 RepID=A0AAD7WQD2_9TELE|nr:hypothetical protein AAFF_G00318900 [Aldrovandia affinis]